MVLDLDDAALLARSDVVGVGSVSQVRAHLSGDGRVVTLATLQLHRPVRGCAEGDALVVELPGGELAGLAHSVSGAPRLAEGQMIVAFLERHGPVFRPLGLAMGVYYVDGGRAGILSARRHLRGLSLVAPTPTPGGARAGRQPVASSEPLAALLARLDGYQAQALVR